MVILNYTIDLFKTHFKNDEHRAEKFKKGFFEFMQAFELREYLDLKLGQINLFLGIYADSFTQNRKKRKINHIKFLFILIL